jgi:hypothetical protein
VTRSFAFVPRYRALAWSAMGVGGAMAGIGALLGFLTVPMLTGALGIALGATYLRSPTWRLMVTIDDAGIAVGAPARPRFRLLWSEIVKVIASPETQTCFVDGGRPERSLLVPGVGAPAPYDIADRGALVEAILAHVPADRIERVASLEEAAAARQPPGA